MNPTPIVIESEFHAPQELMEMLQESLAEQDAEDISLDLREQQSAFRLEPVVLAALATGGASIIAAVVTGVFALLASRNNNDSRIEVETSDGRRVAVPAGTPRDEIEALLSLAADEQPSRVLVFEVLDNR